MISNTEKTLLIASVLLGWGFGFLISVLFAEHVSSRAVIGFVLGGLLVWLIPFALLVLLSDMVWMPLAAFGFGSLGFFLAVFNWYTGVSLLVLLVGFGYWIFSVRYGKDLAMTFSIGQILRGIGFFFTVLALFGSFLYFHSPFSSSAKFNPVIPEQFFDIIYHPISQLFTSQLLATPYSQVVDPEAAKPQIYLVVNGVLAEVAKKYQEYIPFAFAAAAFFFLRAIFIPFKYLLLGVTFLLVKVFLHIGWIRKEKISVEKEIVKFSHI